MVDYCIDADRAKPKIDSLKERRESDSFVSASPELQPTGERLHLFFKLPSSSITAGLNGSSRSTLKQKEIAAGFSVSLLTRAQVVPFKDVQ